MRALIVTASIILFVALCLFCIFVGASNFTP